ncbi:hypothetical protein JDS91_27005 [Bacillus cereus]|uniref:sporulation peptidase YabG n=1 Tax=Bacillus cereus TaxID=1396 RepID=UPI0018F6FE4F|nr:hypothetical protein [Bacillus cereus]HDR8156185.1 hypothetical protein [Bacillus cereus]
MAIQVGDIVAIMTPQPAGGFFMLAQPVQDLWRVVEVSPPVAKVKGVTNRCTILCPINQLAELPTEQITQIMHESDQRNIEYFNWRASLQNPNRFYREEIPSNEYFQSHGSILHIDADQRFMEKCKKKYEELGVKANAYYLDTPEMADNIESLLKQHNPDILVITGHDGLLNQENPMSLESYDSSKYYYNATKKAREFDRDKNSLIIFCGACMSFFEALIQAGANFASSPKRVNIQMFDPVFIAEKISKTPFLTKVNLAETIGSTISGFDGIGGMESIGKSKLTIPKINDVSIPNRNHPVTSPQSVSYKHNPRSSHYF